MPVDLGLQYQSIVSRIRELEMRYARLPHSVKLLAVSKKQSVESIRMLQALGQQHFGENRVQEALPKIQALGNKDFCWHFIGVIQRNKAHLIATHFDWVHSVCQREILHLLAQYRSHQLPPLQVCIQINISQESQKQGMSLEEALPFWENLPHYPNLNIRGLMGMASHTCDEMIQKKQFQSLKDIFDVLRSKGYDVDTLSMGMSEDFPAAIAAGSTWIRLGSALFGRGR